MAVRCPCRLRLGCEEEEARQRPIRGLHRRGAQDCRNPRDRRAFTEAEALSVLRAAAAVTSIPLGKRGWQWAACRRWAPWIMAYTGARGGEITQLRAADVEERPGIGVVVKITPEAGTVKTGKVRVVPI